MQRKQVRPLNWWRGIIEDPKTRLASHAKLLAFLGGLVASGIMIREAIHDRMNSEYFWAYLGILVAGAAASKWIGAKRGVNNVDDGPSVSQK